MSDNSIPNQAKMKINEDYIVLPINHEIDKDDNMIQYFDIQVTKEDSMCDQWVFRIKGVYFPEDLKDEEEDENGDVDATISIDYEIVVPEDYDTDNAPSEVTDTIGECVVDLIESAIKKQALTLKGLDQ